MNWLRIFLWKHGFCKLVVVEDWRGKEFLRIVRKPKRSKWWEKPIEELPVIKYLTEVYYLKSDNTVIAGGKYEFIKKWRWLVPYKLSEEYQKSRGQKEEIS